MLTLPDNLTPDSFLNRHWQKQPLYMPDAVESLQPALTRNELAWLATLHDVESRIVFVDRSTAHPRYRVESGPFDANFLGNLPERDWTLLVHDVEKHIPAMRALFDVVPFIPDWRIDDLMISFAAPGGGVGPHRDHYDVFLCQGIGVRNWCFTRERIEASTEASDDLALLKEFSGDAVSAGEGDILYIPPGVAHWGIAERACMTYSIGMRAPQATDLSSAIACSPPEATAFYSDADLKSDEALPGYISIPAVKRALTLLGLQDAHHNDVARALGEFVTLPKEWLRPEGATGDEINAIRHQWKNGARLVLHGMAQVAYDDRNLYLNGERLTLPASCKVLLADLCRRKRPVRVDADNADVLRIVSWMLKHGAFEIAENS